MTPDAPAAPDFNTPGMGHFYRWQGRVHADVWDLGLDQPKGGRVIEVRGPLWSTYQEALIAVVAKAQEELRREGHYFEVTQVVVFRKPMGERGWRERSEEDDRSPAGGASAAADGGVGTQRDDGRRDVRRGRGEKSPQEQGR